MHQTENGVKTATETATTKPGGARTCDNCRKRKIRCVENPINNKDPCEGCVKIGVECKYEYVKKKPGRKNNFAMSMKAGNSDKPGQPSTSPRGARRGSSISINTQNGESRKPSYNPKPFIYEDGLRSASNETNPYLPTPYSALDSLRSTQNVMNPSISPSATHSASFTNTSNFFPTPNGHSSSPLSTFHGFLSNPTDPTGDYASGTNGISTPGRPWSSFAFSPKNRNMQDNGNSNNMISSSNLEWLDSLFESTTGLISSNSTASKMDDGLIDQLFPTTQFISDQAHLLALESPEHPPGSTGSMQMPTTPSGLAKLLNHTRVEPQLEDVTSWANISHFISLFLRYLYPLLPLVHRPTFAENLATRRDKRDTDFRALLLSIVAYVISQLPTSRLINDTFDIEELKRLQRRCHRTGKALQRTYYGPTNLTQITTIIFDTFYLLSIGLGHTAGSRLGQAVQLAFSMGLHSDEKTAALGMDAVNVQLSRRVFWQLYASDKTRAIPGLPMLINDFQGVCSLPEPVDDEFITSLGMFPQPTGRTSVLAGFVCLSKIFKIVSECFFHHRCVATGLRTVSMSWSVEIEDRLHKILRDMPSVIQDPTIAPTATSQVFAMQRANILITAAIAKFALYDLRAALHVDEEQLTREKENIAREIHSLLMNIPVEDLASNGESVRGKVFHIACALCAHGTGNQSSQELVKDWCNMFSAISFVQMPPPPPGASALESRANSPPSADEPNQPTGPSTGGTVTGAVVAPGTA